MCGLTGIFAPRPRPDLHEIAARMTDLVAHRGPDDSDDVMFSAFEKVPPGTPATIALGHRRLAVQDLTKAGHQPMASPSGRFWMVYNGEIYNFVELRRELSERGVRFSSRSDTEVLLALLELEGEACLPRLEGMFAFLLVDLAERRLLAVRDRFGIKPLYYCLAGDGTLLFASEIKQLTAFPGWQARLNGQRAFDYLTRGLTDHTQETLFEGVRHVPAGYRGTLNLESDPSAFHLEPWYRLHGRSSPEEEERWRDVFLGLLSRSVTRRLRADVRVGACLSGGVDSSAIVALAAEALREKRLLDGALNTFSARHPSRELDEWGYARQTATLAGAESFDVWPSGPRLLADLPDLAWLHDEPFGSTSVFAQYCVFERAAELGARVMLDGQGADEQLAGYDVFFKVFLLELLKQGRFRELYRWLSRLRSDRSQPAIRTTLKSLASWLPASVANALGILRPGAPRWLFDLNTLQATPNDPILARGARRKGLLAFSIEQLSSTSLPMLLRWEDRNSMAHSIEARLPFLDHHLVEFVLGLPSRAKLDGGWTKKILRDAMKGRIPETVRARRDKIAFVTPEREWLCEEGQGKTRRLLETNGTAKFLTPNGRRLLDDILAGRSEYDGVLWRVVCFGAWLQRFGISF